MIARLVSFLRRIESGRPGNGAAGFGEEGEGAVGFGMAAPADRGAAGRLRRIGRRE